LNQLSAWPVSLWYLPCHLHYLPSFPPG
jgi:hypothetical protein